MGKKLAKHLNQFSLDIVSVVAEYASGDIIRNASCAQTSAEFCNAFRILVSPAGDVWLFYDRAINIRSPSGQATIKSQCDELAILFEAGSHCTFDQITGDLVCWMQSGLIVVFNSNGERLGHCNLQFQSTVFAVRAYETTIYVLARPTNYDSRKLFVIKDRDASTAAILHAWSKTDGKPERLAVTRDEIFVELWFPGSPYYKNLRLQVRPADNH